MRTAALLLVCASLALHAQAPASPVFTMVSIRRSAVRGVGSSTSPRPDGGISTIGAPLRLLIEIAYPVHPDNIVGLPAWTRCSTYDLAASSPLGRDATPDERRAMMRAMLEERFKLSAHIEDRAQATPNPMPMRPTGDTRRVLVIDRIERPAEN